MWSSLIPEAFLAWRERRRTLRELRSFAEEEKLTLALDESNLVNQAKIAISLNDRANALRHWRDAMNRYPEFAKASHDSLDVLIGLKLFDEAEMLMLEGKKKEPRDRFYVAGHALVAEERHDFPEALERWKSVQKQFPSWWKGYVQAAICLRRMGQLELAEAQASRAVQLFPDELHVWMEWGHSADARHDWPESICRWEEFAERFRNAIGDAGVARALENLGRLDEADERLEVARLRAPVSVEILMALARISYLRGDKSESARRWANTRQRLPLLPFGYQGEIHLLREMQRYADAEAVALEAMDRFPTEEWPMVEYATLASDREDWGQAVERWAAVRSAWPERGDGYARAAEALSRLGREAEVSELRAELAERSS